MVRIRAFQGHTYSPGDYDTLLKFNHEGLSLLPQHKKSYVQRSRTMDQLRTGMLQQDESSRFYVYKQKFGEREIVGIMLESSIEDYLQQKIKVHEKTLCRPGYNHESYRKDHVGPVILSYRDMNFHIKDLLCAYSSKEEPFSRWSTADGRQHSLWKMEESPEVTEMFQQIDCMYVLDGHHRLQAACDNYEQGGSQHEKDSWFLSLVFPPN